MGDRVLIPWDTLGLFVLASVGLAVAPGPDNVFVLIQSAAFGRRAGCWVTLGLCTGLLVHTTLVALGLAALIAASDTAFTVIKIVGAGYLLYLAWGAFRAGRIALDQSPSESAGSRRLYIRGIVMNVSNPKVTIFFLAFLPQFVSPALGQVALQLSLLGLVFIAVTLLVFGTIALAAAGFGDLLRRHPMAQQVIHRIAGVVFVGLAVRLLASSR